MEYKNGGRVKFSGVSRGSSSNTKALKYVSMSSLRRDQTHQRDITHVIHDHTLVLRCILGNSTKMRFHDMVPI